MILFIILLIISGLAILFSIQPKTKLSNIFCLSLLLGVAIHSFLFLLFGYCHIYYNKTIFITLSIIMIALCFFLNIKRKKKIEITNDLKGIPLIYILFLLYILYRLIVIIKASYVNYYNWDEISFYAYNAKRIFLTGNMNYMYPLYATVNYFLGSLSYSFTEVSYIEPRLFSAIFYIIMSLFIYSRLREFKVHRYISALLSALLLISSAENLLYYTTFYSNIFYATFFVVGVYILLSGVLKDKNKEEIIIGIILLIGAVLVRRESIYHILALLVCLSFLEFLQTKNKKIFKKYLYLLSPFVFIFISRTICNFLFNASSIPLEETEIATVTSLSKGLRFNLLPSFFNNALNQMFGHGVFESNYLIFAIVILSYFIFIFKLLRKKIDNEKKYLYFMILISQIIYLGLVFLTEFLIMKDTELETAASFSRYMLMVSPLSIIMFGALLWDKTSIKLIKIKK